MRVATSASQIREFLITHPSYSEVVTNLSCPGWAQQKAVTALMLSPRRPA